MACRVSFQIENVENWERIGILQTENIEKWERIGKPPVNPHETFERIRPPVQEPENGPEIPQILKQIIAEVCP